MLLYEMLAGRSPFDIVGATDNPDQNTEDYLFQVTLNNYLNTTCFNPDCSGYLGENYQNTQVIVSEGSFYLER